MLEIKAAATSTKRTSDFFDRYITSRTLHCGTCHQHLSLARPFKLTLELLVDCHPADDCISSFVLRIQLYFKRSTCSTGHVRTFLNCSWVSGLILRLRVAKDNTEAADYNNR